MSEVKKDQVAKEQISAILIPKAIDNDASIDTNSESKISILSQGLEIAPLKSNIDSMQTEHEEATSKNNEYENVHGDEDRELILYHYDRYHKIFNFRNNLREWPVSGGKGYSYIHITDLLDKLNIPKEEAYNTLQAYKIQNSRREWAEDVLKYGLVMPPHQYEGWDIALGLDRWYDHEVLTPHGHQFFSEFFAIAENLDHYFFSKN